MRLEQLERNRTKVKKKTTNFAACCETALWVEITKLIRYLYFVSTPFD